MADNEFRTNVDSLFRGMDQFISSKTVVGEAIELGDTTIVPLVDVSFGVAAGAATSSRNPNSGGGIGGKMTPSAVLVISNGSTKMVNVKGQDSLSRILDLVPDVVNRFTGRKGSSVEEEIPEDTE